jgi:hypothetical protein
MPITFHPEDILPEVSYHPSVIAEHTSYSQVTPVETELATDISGCVAIFGPIQICYDINLSIPKAAISLKVFSVTVISGEISPEHPCLTFKGDYSVAKWDLNICLRIPTKRITLEGKACVSFLGCKEFDITLFHWGQQMFTMMAPSEVTVLASTQITFVNNADILARSKVQWGAFFISECTADPGKMCELPTELVWYDVYVYSANTGEEIARKGGVYGNSTVVLVKEGDKYILK